MTERTPGDEPDGSEGPEVSEGPEQPPAASDPLAWLTRPVPDPTPEVEPVETPAPADPTPTPPPVVEPAETPVPADPTPNPTPLVDPPAPPPARPEHPTEPAPTEAMDAVELEATQMMDAIELEPDPPAAPPPAIGPIAPPSAVGAPSEPADPTSALDALFGDGQFREYQSDLAPSPGESPFARRAAPAAPTTVLAADGVVAPVAPPPKGPAASMSRTQKILLWVLAGLLAVLALVALFFLGTRLAGALGPAPAVVTPSATPTPTPTVTAAPVYVPGPLAPGVYEWTELLGGECLEPYASPWDEEFTVVDCAVPHTAQLAFRGVLGNASGSTDFPGADAIAAQIASICAAPGVVDLAAAAAITDAQVQGSYPIDDEQWTANPSYYCFVTRGLGEPLTASIAVPQTAAPVPYPITPGPAKAGL